MMVHPTHSVARRVEDDRFSNERRKLDRLQCTLAILSENTDEDISPLFLTLSDVVEGIQNNVMAVVDDMAKLEGQRSRSS